MSRSSIAEIKEADQRGQMQARLAQSLMELGDALHEIGLKLGLEGTVNPESLMAYGIHLGNLGLAAKELQ